METVKIKRLRPDAVFPTRATEGSAGMDLYACIEQPVTIGARESRLLPTGIAMALPNANYAAFIYARSGLGVKHGIIPKNCVGVIDSDYRGEICVCLHNISEKAYTVNPNDRIAQMVIAPVAQLPFAEEEELNSTERSGGGFGSSGV